jgi:hypothetical protein
LVEGGGFALNWVWFELVLRTLPAAASHYALARLLTTNAVWLKGGLANSFPFPNRCHLVVGTTCSSFDRSSPVTKRLCPASRRRADGAGAKPPCSAIDHVATHKIEELMRELKKECRLSGARKRQAPSQRRSV